MVKRLTGTAVALSQLANAEIGDSTTKTAITNFCVKVHKFVETASAKYLAERKEIISFRAWIFLSESQEVVEASLQIFYSIMVVLGKENFSYYESQVHSALIKRNVGLQRFNEIMNGKPDAKISD
jgi:hypothetical protein